MTTWRLKEPEVDIANASDAFLRFRAFLDSAVAAANAGRPFEEVDPTTGLLVRLDLHGAPTVYIGYSPSPLLSELGDFAHTQGARVVSHGMCWITSFPLVREE